MDPFADLCMGCEKKGTLRCPPCQKAGQDTKFCSKECQKLMWMSHKTYCGKGKQLFFQPELLRVEFDSFVEIVVKGEFGKDAQFLFFNTWDQMIHLCREGLKASPPSTEKAWKFWKSNEIYTKWQFEVLTSSIRSATSEAWNEMTKQERAGYTLHPFILIYTVAFLYLEVDPLSSQDWLQINSNLLYSYINFKTLLEGAMVIGDIEPHRLAFASILERVLKEFEEVKKVSKPSTGVILLIYNIKSFLAR